MIKARNRKLSMLLVLAMLMTMFVGVGTASAAGTTYTTMSAPTVTVHSSNFQKLGSVLIEIPDVRVLNEEGEFLTISLPSGAEFDGGMPMPPATPEQAGVEFDVTNVVLEGGHPIIPTATGIKTAKDTIEIKIKPNAKVDEDNNKGSILIKFNSIKVKSGSGDVVVKFMPNSTVLGPQLSAATIAVIGKGSTMILPKSQKTIGDGGGDMDTLVIAENIPGTFEENEVITVKLPKGFEWKADDVSGIAGAWGLLGQAFAFKVVDDRTLEIEFPAGYVPTDNDTGAGRINIGSDLGGFFEIVPDDNASFGNVYVTVSSKIGSKTGSVKKQDVLVAIYGDYGVKVVEDTKEEVYAGRANQELGEFLIEEALLGSLDAGRSLYFELPKGVKWAKNQSNQPIIDWDIEDGTGILNGISYKLSNGDRKLKVDFKFAAGSLEGDRFSTEAVELRFKDMEVNIEPSFDQDEIAIKVYGKAGVEGEAVVATVVKPVDLKAENPTKVEIGAMSQAAGDILIIENIDEGIMDERLDNTVIYNAYADPQIVITLPNGVQFSKDPTVEVEEGDLEIDDVDYEKGRLTITIDSSSSKKSTIRISDVFLTVDRTVPEGDVFATFKGHKTKEINDVEMITDEGSTALVNWASEESYGKVAIATTITPSQGGHAKFVIGSNIYEIGGVPYVMDAVPYIKDSRSYVPMRYLAQMMGAEIEWSEADQTVTLSKEGETEVIFTIGSTSYTVNGEAMTADVAPEIVNDRSFLPARFAAEAFGANVGWDEATQTVVIVR